MSLRANQDALQIRAGRHGVEDGPVLLHVVVQQLQTPAWAWWSWRRSVAKRWRDPSQTSRANGIGRETVDVPRFEHGALPVGRQLAKVDGFMVPPRAQDRVGDMRAASGSG